MIRQRPSEHEKQKIEGRARVLSDEKYQKKESHVGVQNALETLCPGGGESAQCFLEHDVDEDGNAWREVDADAARARASLPEPNEEMGMTQKGMILQRKGNQIGCFLIQQQISMHSFLYI